jgi:hypothetical protein
MSKKSKIIYSVIAVIVVVVLAFVVGKTLRGGVQKAVDENTADVKAINLPKSKELKSLFGDKIQQLDNLTDTYVLRNYKIDEEEKSITYYYQTHLATKGERLMLTAQSMTEDEFNAQCPNVNIQTDNYAGIDFTFANRILYYVPDDFEMNEGIQQLIDEGTAEVEYGNTMNEAISMQKVCWYENGVGYTLKAYYQDFTFDDIINLVHYFIDNRK